jgi:hypothetical protein
MNNMLTADEQRFMEWWQQNKDSEKKLLRQLLVGLPIGLAIAIPIIISLVSGWYKRANMWAKGHNPTQTAVVIGIALLCIICFAAIFYKRHKWDQYDQKYKELLQKQQQNSAATGN